MTDHLLDHVRPHLDRCTEERIAYIQAPRWIGHQVAVHAHERLAELLSRPPSLRTQGLMLVGPYANGKTMIAERFAVRHLRTAEPQRVWVVQTREGAGLAHFYGSILQALRAPTGSSRDVGRKAEQVDHLLDRLKPRILIFDEFHNALRGRARDVEAVLAFLRRIGRQFDISPVLIGEVAVYDFINQTAEMATRFDLHAVPRWQYGEEFLALLDSLESVVPLPRASDLSDEPLARTVFQLSEGLIGEIVAIISAAAAVAVRSGGEQITKSCIESLRYAPISKRRRAPVRNDAAVIGNAARAAFAIEIRERYGDVARNRWPVSVSPLPDELLSSWLHRLALANGTTPRSFAGVLGLSKRMWSPRLDLRLPRHVATLVCHQTGRATEEISAMTMTGCAMALLLLPLRDNAHRNRSTWMQYCPLCLATDEAPHLRRQWRLASRVSCFAHGCGLRDRCPACHSGIATFDQGELVPQHFCARCGFDLRSAPKVSVKTSARRLERAIADICRVETAKGLEKISDAVARVLRTPVAADIRSARPLTNLSSAARIRCLEALAAKPPDWLVKDMDGADTYRRWMIVAAGGHEALMARFADFLEGHQGVPRPERTPGASSDRSELFGAYLRVMHAGGARASAKGSCGSSTRHSKSVI